jgi:hypothetical protein
VFVLGEPLQHVLIFSSKACSCLSEKTFQASFLEEALGLTPKDRYKAEKAC